MNEDKQTQGNSEWLKTYNLALTDRVACDTLRCTQPATLYSKVKCCGAVIFGCLECLENTFRSLMAMAKDHKNVTCKTCNKVNSPLGWLTRPDKI